ncbi:hypothetical protein AB6A40_006697 [Gnathostoma spinigerum]|uniref:Major facilitator superfamily (MFS) profile domain-containing protein n=1 Tax=Gnathostoma spinigerum TaxID=75299 RepID=A0ABD6EJ34_9BILA
MPLSGLLCQYGFAGGWPSIFYVLGTAALIWSVLWLWLVADTPSKHKTISTEEREYIEDSLRETSVREGEKQPPMPWRAILTSAPFWALIVGHFAMDWGGYIVTTSLPTFMNDVLGLDTTSMGFIGAIPYLAFFIFINVAGVLADALRNSGILSTLNVRRLSVIIGLGLQAVFLIASGYCKCGQDALLMFFLTLAVGLSGFLYAGIIVNYLDIAPSFAGTLVGLGNTISCVAGMFSPAVVGWLTPNRTRENWQLVFWITGGILAIGTIIFCVFADGEVQPWAKIHQDVEEKEKDDLKEKNNINPTPISAIKNDV